MVEVDIGAAISMALARTRMSKGDLAAQLGVNATRVSHLCKAKNCTVSTLCRVASAVDMKPSELLALAEI